MPAARKPVNARPTDNASKGSALLITRGIFLPVAFSLLLLISGCATTGNKSTGKNGLPAAAGGAGEGVPAGGKQQPQYILGVGDKIEISVYRHDDLRKALTIDPSGMAMFPLIGDLQLAGKSLNALRDEMTDRLSKYVVNPEVSITVTSIQSRKTLVLGEVRSPGSFVLDTDLTVLDMISKAGGTTNDANLERVLLVRRNGNKATGVPLNLESAIAGEDLSANVPMQNGDIVVVPPKRIAEVARYMSYVSDILRPFVTLEGGIVLWPLVVDVFTGAEGSTTVVSPAQ